MRMLDGSQEALPGMLSVPFAQASQAPLTSVRPAAERTTRRHSTFSGSPLTCSWMLEPHDVAVTVAVALTCVAESVPANVTAAAGRPPEPDESHTPPATPPAARHAAAAPARCRLPRPRAGARLGGTARRPGA